MLSVSPAPDNLTLPTIVGLPFGSLKLLTEKSVQISRFKAGVWEEEIKMTSKNYLLGNIVGGEGSK